MKKPTAIFKIILCAGLSMSVWASDTFQMEEFLGFKNKSVRIFDQDSGLIVKLDPGQLGIKNNTWIQRDAETSMFFFETGQFNPGLIQPEPQRIYFLARDISTSAHKFQWTCAKIAASTKSRGTSSFGNCKRE